MLPNSIMSPTTQMCAKLSNTSNDDLRFLWDLLIDYDHETFYDEQAGIKMDAYAEAIYSEMDQRGMPHERTALAKETIFAQQEVKN